MAATKPYRYSYRPFNGNRKYDPYGLCEKDPSEEYLGYSNHWTSQPQQQVHGNQTSSSVQDYQYNGYHSSSHSNYSAHHHKLAESIYSYSQDNSIDFQQTSDQQPYHSSTQYTNIQLSSSKKFNTQQSFDQTVYRQTSGDIQVSYDSQSSQMHRANHSQNDQFYQNKMSNGYQKVDSSNITNHSKPISSEYENSQYQLESTHSYHNSTVYQNNEYDHVHYDTAKPQDRWSKALEYARSYYRDIASYNVHNSYDSANSVYQLSHHHDTQHSDHHDHTHQMASTTQIPDRNFNPREMWSKAIYLASPSHKKYDPYKSTCVCQESSKTDAFNERAQGYDQYEGFGSNSTGRHHSSAHSYESYRTNPDSNGAFEENNNYYNYNGCSENGIYYGTDDSNMENEEYQSNYEFDPILIDYLKSLAQVYAMDEVSREEGTLLLIIFINTILCVILFFFSICPHCPFSFYFITIFLSHDFFISSFMFSYFAAVFCHFLLHSGFLPSFFILISLYFIYNTPPPNQKMLVFCVFNIMQYVIETAVGMNVLKYCSYWCH